MRSIKNRFRQVGPALCMVLILLAAIPLLPLVAITVLYPAPGSPLMELVRSSAPLDTSPARLLLEGMAAWYRVLLLLLAFLLTVAVVAAILLLRSLRSHLRWTTGHKEEYRTALVFTQLVETDPILAAEDPWNCNSKSGLAPTPAWSTTVWTKFDKADGLIQEYTSHAGRAVTLVLSGIALVLLCLLPCLMVFGEDVPALLTKTQADIAQIEVGKCEQVTVWLSPKTWPWHIDGPYSSSQPALLTRYGAISEDTGRKWVTLYLPDGMDFELDPNRLYNENCSVLYNAENAQMYQVTYTTETHLIEDIRPVDTPAFYLS